MKLFAVCLGGTAPRANTELHDVVFAVGNSIEETYPQLITSWFGSLEGLHLDSWIELQVIDGYRVHLKERPSDQRERLFFINLGAYIPGQLLEAHANTFLVGTDKKEIISRAKQTSLQGMQSIHRDYLYDVDDCLAVLKVGDYHVHLEKTVECIAFEPVSAYTLIPKELLAKFR